MKPNEENKNEVWALDMKQDGIIYVANVIDPTLLNGFSSTKKYSKDKVELTDVVVLNTKEVKNIVNISGNDIESVLRDCYALKDCFNSHSISHLGKEKPFVLYMNDIKKPYQLVEPKDEAIEYKQSDSNSSKHVTFE